jgi:hypothetical protein
VKASVIIPVHNRPELYARALSSWLAQSEPDFEIIVVDDNSTVPVKVARRRKPPTARSLRLTAEMPIRGPNIAWIAGIEQAQAPVIILTSQDTIVPPDAVKGLLDGVASDPTRRWAMRPAFMTEDMLRHIDAVPWQKRWAAWGDIPGFWTHPTPYGRPNKDIDTGGMHFNATAFTKEWYEWIGGLWPQPWYGINDRDMVEREHILHKDAATVPELFCVHQWHPDEHGARMRALMAHPGYIYRTEAQARRVPEALATISPVGAMPLWPDVAEHIAHPMPGEPDSPLDMHRYPVAGMPPGHVIAIFDHILTLIQSRGWATISLTNERYWATHFIDMAKHRGMAARVGEDIPSDVTVSLMEMQQHELFEDYWQKKNAWLGKGPLLVLVPYGQNFHGGSNKLCFTEAELQATTVDKSLTGYLIGIWGKP